MSKEKYNLPLPGDGGNSFEQQDEILNFRPKIGFVAPEHDIQYEVRVDEEEEAEDTRDRTRALITGLEGLTQLAELTDKRIDSRLEALGGLDMKLDPVVDAATIAAVKRAFPDKADPTTITYDDYKACLAKLEAHAEDLRSKEDEEYIKGFQESLSNPLKTDYGIERPEIYNSGGGGAGIAPLDLVAFQAAAIVGIFNMLVGMITDLVLSLLP